jgi:mannose-6-phosphate isomerase-like protein (cupin superfamily)
MGKPIIAQSIGTLESATEAIAAAGQSFEIHEWSGSGPGYLHVHFADDEAWHVLEGVLTFRFSDHQVEAPAGTTVFVPAGVAHDYFESRGTARYLIILTPRLSKLIAELQQAPLAEHGRIMQRYESAIVK